ncbi:hypothetical protein [Mesorhizobium sp. Z1-4]|uniref:hypothetical protein n=1 Tax=Mesorhizobium sp. Z1-4 TaxID=2448478 RepID=UPI000FD8C657|nr:hypothetical protein [Mesorhizobium sp. Z1-4]
MPDDQLTKATIVNWSLVELGQAPNFSITEETRLGGIVDKMWPRAVARCFGLTDWPFCRRTYSLTRQSATPVTGYRYGFDLPRPRFGPPVKYLEGNPRDNRPVRDTRIEGETVFADTETLSAVCLVEVNPEYWDGQFADCFAIALASYLSVPLLQDIELAREKEELAFGKRMEGGAGGAFGRLIAQHRAAGPLATPTDASTLSGGRSGGAWHGRY